MHNGKIDIFYTTDTLFSDLWASWPEGKKTDTLFADLWASQPVGKNVQNQDKQTPHAFLQNYLQNRHATPS